MTKHPVCFFWLPFQAVKRGNSFGTFDTLHKAPLCERKQSNQFKTEEALNQKECEHKGRERGIVTLHEVHRAAREQAATHDARLTKEQRRSDRKCTLK